MKDTIAACNRLRCRAGHARCALPTMSILRRAAEGDVASVMDASSGPSRVPGPRSLPGSITRGAPICGHGARPAQLLIFGNPALGTPAMQADPLAGLFLPLRVLVYRDGAGQVWLAYEDPADMLGDLDGVDDEDDADMLNRSAARLTV